MIEAQEESERAEVPTSRRAWRPCPSRGGRTALIGAAVLAVLGLGGLAYFFTHPVAIDSFIAAVVGLGALLMAVAAAILARGFPTMTYTLADDALNISWLWIRETIPLGRVEGMFRGQRLGEKISVRGISLPGYYVGVTGTEEFESVRYYGTSVDPSDILLIATANRAYAITPEDLSAFRDRLIANLESIPEEAPQGAPEASTEIPRWLRFSALWDTMALGALGVALLIVVLSFGYVSFRYPSLPEMMPLHYNALGQPDFVGPSRDAFRMPLIGLLLLALNGGLTLVAHAWHRDTGRMVAATTVFIQLIMLVAIVRVVQ